MRIHLITTPNNRVVPFNYQENLTGALHKWLSYDNQLHNSMSLYSFSWLKGGKQNQSKGLDFKQGASWFVSAANPEIIKSLIKGIQENPDIAFGMRIQEIRIQEDIIFTTNANKFFLASPVFIKRRLETGKDKHYLGQGEITEKLMTETLKNKMSKVGLEDNTLRIYFDDNFLLKVKKATYKGIDNKVNMCPVIIEGKPETMTFAWNVGIGNSTGIGFGALQ